MLTAVVAMSDARLGYLVQMSAPHRAQADPALEPSDRARLVAWSRNQRRPADVRDVIALALEFTANHFWFGLGHRTRRRYDEQPRQGNCVEYSHLFAQSVEVLGHLHGYDLKATPVRSEAQLFGHVIPMRGWRTHDWVRVRHGAHTYDVDAAFHDYWLGWDVSPSVRQRSALP